MPRQENLGVRFNEEHFSVPVMLACFLFEAGMLLHIYLTELSLAKIALAALAIVALLMLYSIRIMVDRDSLYLVYGVGLISRTFELAAVESCRIVEDRFFTSWMYRPSGGYVLVLRMRDGTHVIVPSEEAKKLVGIINVKA
jgi:hypothetical protein